MMLYAKQCNECGKGMNAGYAIEGANEHYCSNDCLHKNITPNEFEQFYIGNRDDDDDLGDIQIYWTEWELDDDETPYGEPLCRNGYPIPQCNCC